MEMKCDSNTSYFIKVAVNSGLSTSGRLLWNFRMNLPDPQNAGNFSNRRAMTRFSTQTLLRAVRCSILGQYVDQCCALRRLRELVAGTSSHWSGFGFRAVNMEFMVNKLVMVHVPLPKICSALPQCQYVLHKSHILCPAHEFEPPRGETGS